MVLQYQLGNADSFNKPSCPSVCLIYIRTFTSLSLSVYISLFLLLHCNNFHLCISHVHTVCTCSSSIATTVTDLSFICFLICQVTYPTEVYPFSQVVLSQYSHLFHVAYTWNLTFDVSLWNLSIKKMPANINRSVQVHCLIKTTTMAAYSK